MKEIYLIGTVPSDLNPIKSYLSEVDANNTEFSSVYEASKTGYVPDLIVVFEAKNSEKFKKDINFLKDNPSFSKIPQIYIVSAEIAEVALTSGIIDNQSSFQLPVDKVRFLSTVAEYLKRAKRRVLRIIITIFPEGSNIRYLGVSLDFSETGMAFESIADFPKGHVISVNFVNPRNRKRFFLRSKIVRRVTTQSGGTTFYGVKFIEMTMPDIQELMNFITGKS